MNKFLGIIVVVVLSVSAVFAQGKAAAESVVTAKGVGINAADAKKDALRNAVEQACGVALQSESRMENFALVSDAVASKASGYITKFDIVKEGQVGENYEMTITATVSLTPLRADARLLAQQIGGVRFMVIYDPRTEDKSETPNFDFATERINAGLGKAKYRYIEKKRFEELAKEASRMMEEQDTTELSYAQQLGIRSGAQFLVFIKSIHFDEREEGFVNKARKATIEVKLYDNCTAEGLGTMEISGDWQKSNDVRKATRDALSNAIDKGMDQILETFNGYIGDWINNGTPFEIRIYSAGTFRDVRELRNKLKADPNFGGEMEVVGADDFQKLNCTFRKKPDELADKVLDISDEIPGFKAKRLDVKLIYGRQISFAPTNYTIPGIDGAADLPAPKKSTLSPAGQKKKQLKKKK